MNGATCARIASSSKYWSPSTRFPGNGVKYNNIKSTSVVSARTNTNLIIFSLSTNGKLQFAPRLTISFRSYSTPTQSLMQYREQQMAKTKEITKMLDLIDLKFQRSGIRNRIVELTKLTESVDLWKGDNQTAAGLMKEHTHLSRLIESHQAIKDSLNDYKALIELSEKEGDECFMDAQNIFQKALDDCNELQLQTLLSNEGDSGGCFLEVQAGSGGTDSMDWASILLKMYVSWSERQGHTVSLIDENKGDEAGIRNSIIKIEGSYAYGWLRHETGVHRLVRISPFDAAQRRHTSFASIYVTPICDSRLSASAAAVDLNEKDLKIETMRSGGPGGQHANRTESAVRITHIPTGITAKSQAERSQHRNKQLAMDVLRSRLYERELKKKEIEDKVSRSVIGDNSWSNQIRSYILFPYQLVKDIRTGSQTQNAEAMLAGDEVLDEFMKAALVHLSKQ